MVQFNELRISPDGKNLYIDVSVKNEEYYRDVYIDSIMIDDQDTYKNSGPSSRSKIVYPVCDILSGITPDEDLKRVKLVLDSTDLGSMDKLFFVYVKTKGTPREDTPCGMNNTITMGTVADLYPFYQRAMSYIGELAESCSVPQDFVDYILRLKAMELAIKTCNYEDAIDYYTKFLRGRKDTTVRKGGCGCGHH